MSETDGGGFDWGTLSYAEDAPEEGQPSETEPTPTEPADEAATTADDGRARDDKGRFLPKQEEETPEEAGERLLAGKYKSPEQLEQAYLEAQQLLGSLRSDQGELRAQLEELTTAVTRQSQPRPVQDFEALLESDPQQAAYYALSVGDQQAYARAKSEWNELAPGAPAIWEQNLQLQQQMRDLEARVAGVQAPIQEQQSLRVVADAYRDVQKTIPDFEQLQPHMGVIVDDIAQSGYDWLSPALDSGDKRAIAAAFKNLADLARARASGNLTDQARQAAQEHVAATEQAKREAIVASASTSMSDPTSKTPGQILADEWRQFDISALKYES